MVQSPCIQVCQLQDGVCKGCHRTSDEIENWILLTEAQKEEIVSRVQESLFNNERKDS